MMLKINILLVIICQFITATVVVADTGEAISPPEPRYEIRIERSMLVPMRDGVQLSTDIYFPEGVGDKLPVILIRTQYDKSAYISEPEIPWHRDPTAGPLSATPP